MTNPMANNIYGKWTNIDNVNTISILALIIFFSLPIMNSFSSLFRVGYTVFFIGIFYITVFMKSRESFIKIFVNTVIVFIFIFFSYISQWAMITSFFQQMYFLYLFWVPYIIMLYVLEKNDTKLYKLILKTVLIFFIITCITTIRGISIYPMASRFLATGQSELYNLDMFYRMNIGGYAFIYSLVLFIPTIIYLFKNNKKYRIISLMILILFLITILQSQYTIALILSLPSLSLLFLRKIRILQVLGLILFIYCIIYLVFQSNISEVLFNVSNLLITEGFDFLGTRFNQLAEYLSLNLSQVSDEFLRIILYKKSILTFLSKPIFGNLLAQDYNSIGGHSSLFDTLASLGLFGIVFLIYFFGVFYKKIRRNFYGYRLFHILKYQISLVILLSVINTIFSSVLISVVLFLVSYSVIFVEQGKSRH